MKRYIKLTSSWIHNNDDHFDWYECPKCGYGDEGELQIEGPNPKLPKFCPDCGEPLQGISNIL